jgi:hypothetical protein
MKPQIIVTDMSPEELARHYLNIARGEAKAIQDLASRPLNVAAGETLVDRALLTARHAIVLADAFETLDAITLMLAEAKRADAAADSAPSQPSDHRGVSPEDAN